MRYSVRLLVCEDEMEITRHLQEILGPQSFETVYLRDVPQIERQMQMRTWQPDIVVLDRLFGSEDLISYLDPMKRVWPSSKILILSAIDTPLEKASALEKGADDYLAKPFSKEEFLARVKALNRRNAASSPQLVLKDVTLNLDDRTLSFMGQVLELSLKEAELLKLFFANPGKVFSKDDLVLKVWRSSTGLETNTVESTIVRVRRKLEILQAPVIIKNMRLVGYWLEV